MFDERFRRVLPGAFGPIARALVRRGVSADAVTWLGFLVALVAAAIVASGHAIVGVIVWLIGRLLDALDGLVARESDTESGFGAYLDITLDMIAYSAMVVGFGVLHPAHALVWTAVLVGYVASITTTLALSDAAGRRGRTLSDTNRSFQFTTSLAEAGETSIAYSVWAVFPDWLPWTAWLWVAIMAVAVVERSRLAARVLR